MWESIGTTHRQDRVLHGFAKALNVVVGLIAMPLWLFGQWASRPLRHWLARGGSDRKLPVPPEKERSMSALMDDLRAIPQDLRTRPLSDLRFGLSDISNFVAAQQREGAVLGYRYPAHFDDHVFTGADGERIAATIGLQEAARPALIVTHGVFTSSRFDYVRDIAIQAFYEWGFNVAAIDLRSFGATELSTSAPATGGWKEGLDIIELARYMKELGSTSVGTLGVSLGGSSVLGASHPEAAATQLDGGILAVSPPAVPKDTWGRLAEPVSIKHPRYPIHMAFQAATTSRIRAGHWPEEAEDMNRILELVAAPYYGVDEDEIWQRSAARDHIAEAKVPVLVLHPVDDPIVKVEQAEILAEAAAGNDLVRVWTLPAGSHGLLSAADPEWTRTVYRDFFERWATYAERSSGAVQGNGKLVYSRSQ